MALDRDGAVFLAGSSDAYHLVVRFSVTTTPPHIPVATSLVVQPGALAMEPERTCLRATPP